LQNLIFGTHNASGSAYGVAIYAAAQKPEGEITEVPSYMFPKPGTTTPTFPKGELRNQGRRSGLRCRLLQMNRSEPQRSLGATTYVAVP